MPRTLRISREFSLPAEAAMVEELLKAALHVVADPVGVWRDLGASADG
jgi:hypothetical protein